MCINKKVEVFVNQIILSLHYVNQNYYYKCQERLH